MSGAVGQARLNVVTGVTGFLGQEVLLSVIRERPGEHVVAPIRPSREGSAAERLADVLDRLFSDPEEREDAERRVQALETDLDHPDPSFTERLRAIADGRPCRLIHGAASVSFDQPLELARRINVEGTRRMLEVAEHLHASGLLERFAFVSTAFVAGDREGVVLEDELDVGQGFSNTYERTKLEAEALVREAGARLPVTVFRPSIVAGHSSTGETSSFKVLYWPIRALVKGWVVCIPGDPAALYDIVPVDFVAQSMLHILDRGEGSGASYHLTAGQSISLERLVDISCAAFDVPRRPPYVPPRLFFPVVKPLLWLTLFGRPRRVIRVGSVYIPYLSRRLVFDNRNTAEALAPTPIRVPEVETYVKTVLDYARRTDFGSRSSA